MKRQAGDILPAETGQGAEQADAASARAGAASANKDRAAATMAETPPRRERSLSFAVRIVSGITCLPQDASIASATLPANRWTLLFRGLWPKEFQTVNVSAPERRSLFQRLGAARDIVDADAGKRGGKGALGFGQRRTHHVGDQR